MEQTAAGDEALGRPLDVQDPRPGGHPLGVAVGDDPATAVRVLVLEDPVEHVGHRFEPAVRMPRRSLGLPRRVLDLTHLIHVDEWVEVGQIDAGERPADGESLPLEPGRRGDHGPNRAYRDPPVDDGDPLQRGDVIDRDGRHGSQVTADPSGHPSPAVGARPPGRGIGSRREAHVRSNPAPRR